ncbi:MAG: manganese efflux pump [Abditibacteriota bacterium]|nr:manganese efflux pump [Abditibacteriota bacterium]
MDAFSVSAANNMRERMSLGKQALCSLVYAFFQALMPFAGWLLIHTLLNVFEAARRAAPVVAMVLLCWIGIGMLRKKPEGPESGTGQRLTFGVLLLQGVATSIDALSAGTAMASYSAGEALLCCLIISVITFFITLAGARLGSRLGSFAAAEKAGGVILILIGVEIFVNSLLR